MNKLTHKQDRFLIWLLDNKHLIKLETGEWSNILTIICEDGYSDSDRDKLNRFATFCKGYYEKYLNFIKPVKHNG